MPTESEAFSIYKSPIHFDGLNMANWSREIFLACSLGGITASPAPAESEKEHTDLIIQAHSVRDIRRAKEEGKTAVLLSWRNTAGIEDQIDYLRVFRDLDVQKMQVTYNTANYSGAGYTDWGIVVDLSHVGPVTTRDVIEYVGVSGSTSKPPRFSHILPAGLKEHPRNKSDELIKLLGEKGGFIGLNQFGPDMEKGNKSTIDDYVAALDCVIGLVGEDLVGIGSDSSEGHARLSEFMAWCNLDKGQTAVKPLGALKDRAELAKAVARAGWSEEKMRKGSGGNWLS
ncbi:uncharacterized protein BDV17DRAFT_297115 [Aspergillus undulatus]|uniref:uncharacterized protein n=1 Tax=Aspergillus undulatus TaxID=1810928 RepID=UPI003CCCED54